MSEQVKVVVPLVGLEKLYWAELIKDDNSGAQFKDPIYLAGVKKIGIKPKYNTDAFYAENILWLSEDTLENVAVEIDITDLLSTEEAMLLGHKEATEGGVIYSENDKAPEGAILFKANKGNKKARYIALYRGKFTPTDEDYEGKEGKANFQVKKLVATFAPLKNNGRWKWRVDEEEGMDDEGFFDSVVMPTPKTETTTP